MPVLMMVGRDDEIVHCNPAVQRAVFDLIPGEKEFHETPRRRFGLPWHPGPVFDQVVARQIAFLTDSLWR
jgi:hypothetical protein